MAILTNSGRAVDEHSMTIDRIILHAADTPSGMDIGATGTSRGLLNGQLDQEHLPPRTGL